MRGTRKYVLLILTIAVVLFFTSNVYASNFKLNVSVVTASSYQTGYESEKAIDSTYNSSSNYWAANAAPSPSTPQWISFDLGSMVYVGAIDIYSNVGYGPKDFTIETSSDGSTFTVQKTVSMTSDKRSFYDWTPLKARYVRIKATAGFNNTCRIQEVFIFPKTMPYRVLEGGGYNFYDFSRLTNAGFDALANANVSIMGLIAASAAPGVQDNLLPNGGDPSVEGNYSWTKLDEIVSRFSNHGIDLLMGSGGLTPNKWPEFYVPLVDENNNTYNGGMNPFYDTTLTNLVNWQKQITKHYNGNPYVRVFVAFSIAWRICCIEYKRIMSHGLGINLHESLLVVKVPQVRSHHHLSSLKKILFPSGWPDMTDNLEIKTKITFI